MTDDTKQPFMAHLEELRRRLVACAIAVGVGFVASYAFCERLFQVLIMPLKAVMPEGERLIFTNLPEMFFVYVKVALLSGVLLTAPFIFYQLWMFVAPGLYQREKRYVIPFVVVSTILFVGGSLFGYFVVFPFGFRFFIGLSNEYVKALPSVNEYFSFSIKILFAFGIVFELPVVLFFLTKMGMVTPDTLRQQRKYAILLIFVVSAILTPGPDVISQFMMAIPLMVLYEIGILVSVMARKKKEEKAKAEEATEKEERKSDASV